MGGAPSLRRSRPSQGCKGAASEAHIHQPTKATRKTPQGQEFPGRVKICLRSETDKHLRSWNIKKTLGTLTKWSVPLTRTLLRSRSEPSLPQKQTLVNIFNSPFQNAPIYPKQFLSSSLQNKYYCCSPSQFLPINSLLHKTLSLNKFSWYFSDLSEKWLIKGSLGTPLGVPWLRCHATTAGGRGSTPDWRAQIPQVLPLCRKKKGVGWVGEECL